MVTDMNGRGGRRKKKPPQRGLGVEQLERLIQSQERQPTTLCTMVPNIQFPPAHVLTPVYLFHGAVVPFGFRFECSKVLSSIPIYNVKLINDGRNICRNNAKTRCRFGQVSEVTSVHRISESPWIAYDFFPEKVGGSKTDIGTPVGETISGIEEGNVSPVDLSLKLSH